jgi:hypothetical protein
LKSRMVGSKGLQCTTGSDPTGLALHVPLLR